MEDEGKAHSLETASSAVAKKAPEDRAAEIEEDVEEEEEIGEDIMAWLADETLTDEVMELLDAEDGKAPYKVRFIDDPYSSSLVFQTTPSSYVTINGNEESCGSSFSDGESSVMASVDMGGLGFRGGAWKKGVVKMEMEEEGLDEALARFIGDDFLLSDSF